MSALEKARPTNKVDDKIIALAATHSMEEISQALGGILSPAKVGARAQVLFRSKDWLTTAQEDQAINIRFNNILLELESRYMDTENAQNRISVLKEMGKRLDVRRAATQVDLNTLYGNQGRIMGRVFDKALAFMKGALREEVDSQRWDDLAEEALLNATTELQQYEAVEA